MTTETKYNLAAPVAIALGIASALIGLALLGLVLWGAAI